MIICSEAIPSFQHSDNPFLFKAFHYRDLFNPLRSKSCIAENSVSSGVSFFLTGRTVISNVNWDKG